MRPSRAAPPLPAASQVEAPAAPEHVGRLRRAARRWLREVLGEPDGLIKTVFDARTGELLGAHMVGAEVTELIQGYVVARQLETTEAELMETVFAHPTLSEAMHEAVLDAYKRALHF